MKTNIFVDCHVFDGTMQGTSTYLKGLYKELIKETDKHFFLTSSNPEKLKAVFGIHDNITFLKYKSKNKFLRLIFDIPDIIKKHKIEYAHFQYIVPPIKRCKYIVTVHDVLFIDFPEYFPFFNRIKNTFLYRFSANISDIILTVSEYSKEKIQTHFGIQNILITTNAVDEAFFESYDKQDIKEKINTEYGLSNYLIYVSRWEPRKNHHLLLKSFVDLELYKKYQLLFIGDESLENKKYNDYFQGLEDQIKKKIVKLEKVDFETMLLLLRGSEASIYPSIAEGFGIPPLESIAAKIPTISSNATAMQDFKLITPHTFNPLNKTEFEEQLLILLNTGNQELEQLKQNLKVKYNWQNAAKVLNDAIDNTKKK